MGSCARAGLRNLGALGRAQMIRSRPAPASLAEPKSEKPRRDGGSGPRRLLNTGTRPRPTVLIVDDDEDARELYVWSFRAAGWIVVACSTGEEALLVAAALSPDGIVMDLLLPKIGGLDAIRHLKGDPEARHIPIVAISVMDRRQAEPLATEAGCEVFLSKPFQPEHLLSVVERFVREP
jgi:two-component system, cell cycle response regulator DivK